MSPKSRNRKLFFFKLDPTMTPLSDLGIGKIKFTVTYSDKNNVIKACHKTMFRFNRVGLSDDLLGSVLKLVQDMFISLTPSLEKDALSGVVYPKYRVVLDAHAKTVTLSYAGFTNGPSVTSSVHEGKATAAPVLKLRKRLT